MKKIHLIFSAFVLVLFCISCNKEPNFPAEPYIEFREIVSKSRMGSNFYADSITITVYVRDGDNDLGDNYGKSMQKIEEECRKQPNRCDEIRMGIFNYMIDIYKNKQKVILQVGGTLNGFLSDNPNSKIPFKRTFQNKSESELTYSFVLFYSDIIFVDAYNPKIQKGDRVSFRIKVRDQAGNLSNEIETPEIILGQ
jgi:hypothetical protein